MRRKVAAFIHFFAILFMIEGFSADYSKHGKQKIAVNRDKIPSLADLFGKKTESGTEYEILGCEVSNSKNGCLWSFIPDDSCQENLSLTKVYNLLASKSAGDNDIASITKIFPPGSFRVKKFTLGTCGEDDGMVDFICSSTQPFDIIEDKLKVVKVELKLNFNYNNLKSSFNYRDIEFTLKGEVQIGTQSLNLELIKVKNTLSEMFKLSSKAIKAAEFYKIFSTKKSLVSKEDIEEDSNTDNEKDLLKAGGMFSNLVIEEPLITGSRNEDGKYEFIVNGKATGIAGFGEIKAFLVVQKPAEGPTGVGIIASLKNVQPLKVLSLIIGKDINNIEIIKDVEVDLAVQYANQDITELGDSELVKLMKASVESGSGLVKGAVIDVTIPIKEILKKTGTAANLENISKSIAIQILIKDNKVSFKFPDDLFNDGMNILAALVPKAVEMLQKYIFKSAFSIKFETFDVNVKTKEVDIAVSVPDDVVIKFITLKEVYFKILYDVSGNFEFKLNAVLKFAEATAEITIEKKGKVFELSGSIASLTSEQLMQTFGSSDLVKNVESKSKSFNFGICDLQMTATFGEGGLQEIRLIGNPILFNWEGMQLEGFIIQEGKDNKRYKTAQKPHHHELKSLDHLQYFMKHNETELMEDFPTFKSKDIFSALKDSESKQITDAKKNMIEKRSDELSSYKMGLAVLMKNIRVDHIIQHLFKKTVMGTNWMVDLNMALIISNTVQNKFKTQEVKDMFSNARKGVYFSGELRIPEDCMKNPLCEFAKKKMKPGAKLFVTAGFNNDGFNLKAGYNGDSLELLNSNKKVITLNSAYFDLSIGLKNEFMLKAKLTLEIPEKLVFEVGIGLSGSGALKFSALMTGMWMKPFHLNYFAIGNTELTVTLQPPMFNPLELALSGQINIGMEGKEIIAKVAGGINLLDPKDNYIYASINKLTLAACAEAFGFVLKLPQVILDTGFPDGLVVGYALSPKGVEVKQLGIKISSGLTLQGTVNVLGYSVKALLTVNPTSSFQLEAEFSPISFFNGAFGLYLSMGDKTRGPKVLIHLSSSVAKFIIRGSITVLGISAEVNINIGNEGLEFSVAGSLFGIVEANLTVKAPYGAKLSLIDAAFSVSACLSTKMADASNEANKVAKAAAQDAKNADVKLSAKKEKTNKWYDTISKSVTKFEEKLNSLRSAMTISADKIQRYTEEINAGCSKSSGLMSAGKCNIRLLYLKSKIEKKFAKQAVRDLLYKGLEKLVQGAKYILTKAKSFIDRIEIVFKSAQKSISVGLQAAKDIANYIQKNIIEIHHACFETSLEKAAKACFGINVNVTLLGKFNKAVEVQACLDFSFTKSIGKAVTDILYPGASDVTDQIKTAMGKIEGEEQKTVQLEKEYKESEVSINKMDGEIKAAVKEDSDEDDNTKKDSIIKKWTLAEIRRQMYNDLPNFASDDIFNSIYPKTKTSIEERAVRVRAVIPIDVDSLYEGLSDQKNACLLKRTLAKNFLQISDRLQAVQRNINAEKRFLRRENKLFSYNMNEMEKSTIEYCKQENCTLDEQEDLLGFFRKHRNAHLDRMKNFDRDLSLMKKRVISKARLSVERQVLKKNHTMDNFLEMLELASKNVAKKSVDGKRFDTAYNVLVKNFLKNDDISEHDVRAVKKVNSEMAEIRDHIPCAA